MEQPSSGNRKQRPLRRPPPPPPPQSRSQPQSSMGGSMLSVGTTALAVYGAYQLVSWAYQHVWNPNQNDNDAQTQFQQQNGHAQDSASPFLSSFLNGSTGRSFSSSSQPNNDNAMIRRRYLRQRTIRQGRTQVRRILNRFVSSLVKRQIWQATDFQPQRQALQALRRQKRQEHAEKKDDLDQPQPSHLAAPTGTQSTEQQEQELWNSIVVQSISRFVLTLYAPSLLFVVLTAQVSMLISLSCQDKSEAPQDDTKEDSFNKDHEWILDQTYHYFFEQGLPSLIATVQRTVQHVLQYHCPSNHILHSPAYSPDSPWTCGHLQTLLNQIHQQLRQSSPYTYASVSNSNGLPTPPRSLVRLVQPPSVVYDEDEVHSNEMDDNQACRRQWYSNHIWDFLASPMVDDAVHDCIRVVQHQMLQDVFLPPTVPTQNSENVSNHCPPQSSSSQTTSLAMAQLVTRLKTTCHAFFSAFSVSNPDDQHTNDTPQQSTTSSPATTKENAYLRAMEHVPPILEIVEYIGYQLNQ